MTITVADFDKLTGCRHNAFCCAVAVALNRATHGVVLPHPRGWAADYDRLTPPGGAPVPTPAHVAAWMQRYDAAADLGALPDLVFTVP